MFVFWSACLSCLPVSQTSVDDSGHKGNTGQLLNSRVLHGCAVINNPIYDSSLSLSVSVKVLVCTQHPLPPPFLQRGVGLSLQPNFKKGGLKGPQLFRGGLLGKREVTFFRGGRGCHCHIINKNLKYLMTKKVYKQKDFSL